MLYQWVWDQYNARQAALLPQHQLFCFSWLHDNIAAASMLIFSSYLIKKWRINNKAKIVSYCFLRLYNRWGIFKTNAHFAAVRRQIFIRTNKIDWHSILIYFLALWNRCHNIPGNAKSMPSLILRLIIFAAAPALCLSLSGDIYPLSSHRKIGRPAMADKLISISSPSL